MVGIAVECAVGIVGSVCVATADDGENTGDDVTRKLVGSTEVSWMKELEVDPTIGIGAVVRGRSVVGGNTVGVGGGMTGKLFGSVVMRDTASGSQQETE